MFQLFLGGGKVKIKLIFNIAETTSVPTSISLKIYEMVFKSVLIKKNPKFLKHTVQFSIYISTTPHTGRDMQIHKLKRSNQGTCN